MLDPLLTPLNPTPLTCGDRVFYVDHAAHGSERWRKALVLQRKQDYVYHSGIYRSHGYDLYDVKNCTTVSRTRQDIRKYKHTKIERELLVKANKHLEELNREFLKSDFYNPNDNKPSTQEPEIKQEPMDESTPEITEIPAEDPAPTPAPTTSKGSRMLKNLKSDLDGSAWACNDTHVWRLRVRTTKINEEEEYLDHWDNITTINDENIEEKTLTSPNESQL